MGFANLTFPKHSDCTAFGDTLSLQTKKINKMKMKNTFERFVHYLIYIIVLLSPVVARATEPPSEAQPSVFIEGVVKDSEG